MDSTKQCNYTCVSKDKMIISKEELVDYYKLNKKNIWFITIFLIIACSTTKYWWNIPLGGNLNLGILFILIIVNLIFQIYFMIFKKQLMKIQFFILNQLNKVTQWTQKNKK